MADRDLPEHVAFWCIVCHAPAVNQQSLMHAFGHPGAILDGTISIMLRWLKQANLTGCLHLKPDTRVSMHLCM
jgi:hypothetical protein